MKKMVPFAAYQFTNFMLWAVIKWLAGHLMSAPAI
jgi:hypothetical protein